MSTPTTLYDTIMNQLQTALRGVPDTQLTNLTLLVATAAETQHGQLGPWPAPCHWTRPPPAANNACAASWRIRG